MGGDFDDSFYDSHPNSAAQRTDHNFAASTPDSGFAGIKANIPTTGSKRSHDSPPQDGPSPKKTRLPVSEGYLQRHISPDVEQPKPPGFNVSSDYSLPRSVLTQSVQPVNAASNYRPTVPQVQTTTQLPQPPVVPSSGPYRVNSSESSANLKNSPATKNSPLTSHLPQADNTRTPLPSTPSYSNRMVYNDRNASPHINEPLIKPYEKFLARKETANNATAKPEEPVLEIRPTPPTHTIVSAGDNMTNNLETAAPKHEVPLGSPNVHNPSTPSLGPSTQAPGSINETRNPPHTNPVLNPVLPINSQSANSRPLTVIQHLPPTSASPAANEDPRALAYRTVLNFSSEIRNLKQAKSTRETNIAAMSQQLANFAHQHSDVDRAKHDEITRALQEVERRYEGH